MSKQQRMKAAPAPEIIERGSGPWKVRAAAIPDKMSAVVSTSLRTRDMIVPLDDSDASAWARRHEMARLAWSPDVVKTDGVPAAIVQAFEEARLNGLLKKHRFDTETHRGAEAVLTTLVDPTMGGVDNAALTRVALSGTSDEAVAAAWLNATDPRIASGCNEALRELRKDLSNPESALRAAKVLQKYITAPKSSAKDDGSGSDGSGKDAAAPRLVLPPTPAPPIKAKASVEDLKDAPSREQQRRAEKAEQAAPVVVFDYEPEEGRASRVPLIGRVYRSVPWGTMFTVVPPMPLRLPRRVGKGKWRPADSGAHPRRMERWASDQAVFSTKGRQRSGTVLIDGSGSMGLSHGQILAVLLRAPAATVAVYSGGLDQRGHHDGMVGVLHILARRGRRVAAIPRRGSGNIVDGPALRWLARQKAPRLWVCDEGVTGTNDNASEQLLDEARGICGTFGIKRVEDVESAIKVLGGSRQEKVRLK